MPLPGPSPMLCIYSGKPRTTGLPPSLASGVVSRETVRRKRRTQLLSLSDSYFFERYGGHPVTTGLAAAQSSFLRPTQTEPSASLACPRCSSISVPPGLPLSMPLATLHQSRSTTDANLCTTLASPSWLCVPTPVSPDLHVKRIVFSCLDLNQHILYVLAIAVRKGASGVSDFSLPSIPSNFGHALLASAPIISARCRHP